MWPCAGVYVFQSQAWVSLVIYKESQEIQGNSVLPF